MLRPTDSLRADHQLIARAVGALQSIADSVRADCGFPADDIAELLRFLREFVLAVHLRKEADYVWPAVAMRGDDHSAELVGELMRRHEDLVALLPSLMLFWEPDAELSADERLGFAETVAAVAAQLQRLHQIEDEELFALTDHVVPPDDQIDWVHRFAQLDHERTSRAAWERRLEPLLRCWQR